jgi:hypothetical protein
MQEGPIPSSDGHHDRADWNMVIRAQREGWPVKQAIRLLAIERAERDLEDENPDIRDKARKFLIGCDAENRKLAEFLYQIEQDTKDRNPDENPKRKRIILERRHAEDEA